MKLLVEEKHSLLEKCERLEGEVEDFKKSLEKAQLEREESEKDKEEQILKKEEQVKKITESRGLDPFLPSVQVLPSVECTKFLFQILFLF